jgi:hypothetical protein
MQQDRQCMYNVPQWRVRVTTVAVEKHQRILCVVELNGTVKYLEISSAVQQRCCYKNETYAGLLAKCHKLH